MIPVEEYKKILENMPICCVDVVIRRGDNAVLLVKRRDEPAKGLWWFPGGRLLKKEQLEAAAVRKVAEETGLEIEIEKTIGCYETIFDTGPLGIATGTHSINITFLANLCPDDQDLVEMDKTSLAFKWFKKSEYDDLDDYVKKILDDSECWAETSSDYYFCALFDIASGISGLHDDLKLLWPGSDEWVTPHEFGLKIRRMIARGMDADNNQKERDKDREAE